MSDDAGDASVAWPVGLRGVTEAVATTRGPNGRWNLAALGVHAPDEDGATDGADPPSGADGRATATTWGRTRTRRNFAERGGGYVQFTRDPIDFVEAALAVRELDDPLLESADAWARVSVRRREAGSEDGTEWVEWALRPVEAAVERESVPTTNRGYNAVVEATVAASRLDVDAYETARLRERLSYFESVVDRCGGAAERAAFERLTELVDADW